MLLSETSRALLAIPKRKKRAAIREKLWAQAMSRKRRLSANKAARTTPAMEKRSFVQPVGKEIRSGARAKKLMMMPICQPLNPMLRKWSGTRKKTEVTVSLREKLTK